MKTTLELPDDLMRNIRIRATQSDRRLKDVIEELLRRGLEAPSKSPANDPVQAWRARLVFDDNGRITNPDGIEDETFFQSLEQVRDADRQSPPRDPFDEQA